MGGATKAPRRRRTEVGFWENLCGTGRNDRAPGENIEEGSDDDDGDQVRVCFLRFSRRSILELAREESREERRTWVS